MVEKKRTAIRGSGAAITVDGSALRCGFSAPCEGTFLDMKKTLNPARREG